MEKKRAIAIYILATMTSDTEASIDMLIPHEKYPVPGAAPEGSLKQNSVMVEMLNDKKELLLRCQLFMTSFCNHPITRTAIGASVQSISGTVPLPAEAIIMQIKFGTTVIASCEIPEEGPQVELLWTPADPLTGLQEIVWNASHPKGIKMKHHVCVVMPGRSEWRGLNLPQDATNARIDFDQLPGGKIAIGVVSIDGFNTTRVTSDFFELPLKSCKARIEQPDTEVKYLASQPILLEGHGYYQEDLRFEKNFLHWETGTGEALGCGRSIEVLLPAGEHEIVLTAGVPGREGSKVMKIRVY
jgi:hypothetical protein